MIAIKKIVLPPMDTADLIEEDGKLLNMIMMQIRSGIKTTGQIRHRNLHALQAHITRPDCHLLSGQNAIYSVQSGNILPSLGCWDVTMLPD